MAEATMHIENLQNETLSCSYEDVETHYVQFLRHIERLLEESPCHFISKKNGEIKKIHTFAIEDPRSTM